MKEKRTSKFIKISYDLAPGMPVYPGNPVNKTEPVHSLGKGDHCNTFAVTFFNHNGSHIDAPNHFDRDGRKISDFQIEDFIFSRPLFVDTPKRAGECVTAEDLSGIASKECDILLIRTGFFQKRDTVDYTDNNPWLSPEAAALIREDFGKTRAVGIDTISIGSHRHPEEAIEAHRILLGQGDYRSRPVMIVEDLNLGAVIGPAKRLYAIPLFVRGVDSMPCTVFVEV